MKKLFTLKYLLLSFFCFFLINHIDAQIAGWDFTGSGNTTAAVATTFNANLVSTSGANNITRGNGAASSSGANSFRTVGFQNNGIAVANTDYFQITLTSQPGFNLSLSGINGFMAGTSGFATSPGVTTQFAYSLNGTIFNLIGNPVATIGTPATLATVNLSGISDLQNVPSSTTVTIRFYASGQTTTGGWGFISSSAGINGLAIGGTVAAPSISTNADLSNLSLSTGTLSPSFASSTTSYTSTVANSVTGITVTPTTANANATIKVNNTTVASSSASSNISLSVGSNTITTVVTAQDGTTTKTYTTTVTRATPGTPILTTTSALTDFGNVCTNTIAGPNSFTLDGSNLDGTDIVISAISGFSYSLSAGGPFTSTLNIPYTAPGFSGKVIFVNFNPTMVQSYNGNLVLNGGGVSSFNVSVTGSGINTKPSLTTVSSNVTATTATVLANISATGCTSATSYGFEYSSTTGFGDGTGTQVSSSNLSGGNFSATITGLSPNTRYYYKAIATNAGGTTYGAQLAFTNTPLPVLMSAEPNLSYTQNFSDVGSWGSFFTSGNGANHFGGLSANGSGTIPDGITTTASTSNFNSSAYTSSGGIHRFIDAITATQSIIFLSTGSTDNSSAAALDFYMDFTGVTAGTLSFDYQMISNSLSGATNNRAGSFRVYATTNGTTFAEVTNILNFVNDAPISGSKTNIQLPASFNGSATARLRFYYHNGSGGTTGSRPKISIDNLTVTGVANTPCTIPTAAATNLTFGTITDVSIQGSFTASSPATDNYMVVMSTNSSLVSNPVNGQIYNIGDNVGDGSVIAKGTGTTFTATGLTALTTYYFFVFPVNSVCNNGPKYYTTTVLNGNASTIAGLPNCVTPVSQPTNLVFGTTNTNSIQGSFTATTVDQYLIVRSTSATLSVTPVNGQPYNYGDAIGNAIVVQRNNSLTFNATGLLPNTTYYFFIFSANNQSCINGPAYNTTSPLNSSQATMPLPACTTPSTQASNLVLNASNNAISGTFIPSASADDYLVIRSMTATLSSSPVDNMDYNIGDVVGGGTVVSNSSNSNFLTTNLTANSAYYFFVFAANKNCSGGTKYFSVSPLTGNMSTTNMLANNVYFGNLHSHSDYSDGNKDNSGYTPADDYNNAITADCMDYLGISEHNHFSTPNNPGNQVGNYHLGSAQANSFTSSKPNFVALYGMEWGVISGGGHVIIYGDGMDNLFGWESGSGTWGSLNNYDVFVPKNVYTGTTGLFKTINDNIASNTFATLAHPSFTDYNGIGNTLPSIPYDIVADNAIVGTAVESGPSSSTNLTYSDPATMLYLPYYETMLSKGYHLGATIDHDNHNTTFGKTTKARTAIIAPLLTKTELVKGMRNMHFYATEDCDTKVDFIINTKIMGSIITDRFGPSISVKLSDATTNVSSAVIRVMYGIPGSGLLPVKIDSIIGSSLSFTDNNLADLTTGYYYLDINNGASRIVTSPIWYTRNDASSGILPITLNSFTVNKIDKSSQIKWHTENETNSSYFSVERSAEGRIFNEIKKVTAAGYSNSARDYMVFDNAPLNGFNYYRLKQVDKDGKFIYSTVKSVLFSKEIAVTITPNPASTFINIYFDKKPSILTQIVVMDANGKVIEKQNTTAQMTQISTVNYAKGIYFIKTITPQNAATQKIIIQ